MLKDVQELLGEAIEVVKDTSKLVKLARTVEVSAALEKQLASDSLQVRDEVIASAHAAVLGVAIHLMKVAPSFEVVDKIIETAHSGPGAPFRVARLLGEAAKSASGDRRRFLATFFYGLPATRMPEHDRDRVDMLAERLHQDDILLLRQIADAERPASAPLEAPAPAIALTHGKTYLLSLTAVQRILADGNLTQGPVISTPSLPSLVAHGCITLESPADEVFIGGVMAFAQSITITALGTLLLDALADLRPALDAALQP